MATPGGHIKADSPHGIRVRNFDYLTWQPPSQRPSRAALLFFQRKKAPLFWQFIYQKALVSELSSCHQRFVLQHLSAVMFEVKKKKLEAKVGHRERERERRRVGERESFSASRSYFKTKAIVFHVQNKLGAISVRAKNHFCRPENVQEEDALSATRRRRL